MSLATKYRPRSWDAVVGQDITVKTLKKILEKGGEYPRCFLLCGPSGCGKTTAAHIMGHEINPHVDPLELDAASNSGVDDVRNLIDMSSTKALAGEYRVIIVDECHALSSTAWQAFLKTLEEPQGKTIFIFCTTESGKVPLTVQNRCIRFNFKRVSAELIQAVLEKICKEEQINYTPEALRRIAKYSNGHVRNAITCLEKVSSYESVTEENVTQALGATETDTLFDLIDAVVDRREGDVLRIIQMLNSAGEDFKVVIQSLTSLVLDISKFITLQDCSTLGITDYYISRLQFSINFEGAGAFYYEVLRRLLEVKKDLRNDPDPKATLEILCMGLCRC